MVTIPCYQPSSSPTTVTVSSFEPTSTLVTITNYQPVPNYNQNVTYQITEPNHQSGPSLRGAYDINGLASMVTVSNYSNGSSSPFSSDTNEGGISQSRYNKSSEYPRNSQENGNTNKYSRTYISQDNNTDHYPHNTILLENTHRENRYHQKNSGHNTNNSFVQSTHRSYSNKRSIKEKNGQYCDDTETFRQPDLPEYQKDSALQNEWEESHRNNSPQNR